MNEEMKENTEKLAAAGPAPETDPEVGAKDQADPAALPADAVTGETSSEKDEAAEISPAPKKKGLSEDSKEWIRDIGTAVIIAVLLLQFIQPTIVREHSMENTLKENDYLFMSKQTYKLFGKDPAFGDIIVFMSSLKTENGQAKLLIKRVIGTPGDTVAIHSGTTYINGTAIDESFTKDGYTNTEMDEITVPENCLFVMGDNRLNSADSRDSRIGMVDIDTIVGKAVFRLFPLKKIGGLYSK